MTTNLTYKEALIANTIDEKLATQARQELDKFFENGFELSNTTQFIVSQKNGKRTNNKSAHIPAEIIQVLMIILKKIEYKKTVKVSGKKARLLPSETREVLGITRDAFERLVEENKIKVHRGKNCYYVLMSDIIKYKRKKDNAQEKLLNELAADMQAEMHAKQKNEKQHHIA